MAEKQYLYFLDTVITENGKLYTNQPVLRSKPTDKNAISVFTLNKTSKRIYGELCGLIEEAVDKFEVHVTCDGSPNVHVSAKYKNIVYRFGNGTPAFSVTPENKSVPFTTNEVMECFLGTIFNDIMENNTAQICDGKKTEKQLHSNAERYRSVNHSIIDLANEGNAMIENYTVSPPRSPPGSPPTGELRILNIRKDDNYLKQIQKERHLQVQKVLREKRKNVEEKPEIEKMYIQLHNMKKDPSLKNEYQNRYPEFMTLYVAMIKKGEYVPEYIIEEIRRDRGLKTKYADAQEEIIRQVKGLELKKKKFINFIDALEVIEREGKQVKRKVFNEYLDSLVPLAKRLNKTFVPVYLDSNFTEHTDINPYIKLAESLEPKIVEKYTELLVAVQAELARITNEITEEIAANTYEINQISHEIMDLLDLLQDSKDDYFILFGTIKEITELEKLQQRFDFIKNIEDKTQEHQELMWTFFNLYFKMKNDFIPEYIHFYMKNEPNVKLYIKVMHRMVEQRIKKSETESHKLLKQLKENQNLELKEKYKTVLQLIMRDKTLLEKINKNLVTVSSFGKNLRLERRTSYDGSFNRKFRMKNIHLINQEIKYLTMKSGT